MWPESRDGSVAERTREMHSSSFSRYEEKVQSRIFIGDEGLTI